MNIFKILTILFLLIISNSCCSQKEKATQQKETIMQVEKVSEKEMINQGYVQASVIYDKEKATPCSYLIKLNDKMFVEPLRELKSEFKHDNMLIWVKYHPQRRMSRCGHAQPVEIIGVKVR